MLKNRSLASQKNLAFPGAMGPPPRRRDALGVVAASPPHPRSGGPETFWVERELLCDLMRLFYRWRDKDPDKPRGDFQVPWRSWGRAVAGSLASTLLERRLLHPGPPVRPAGGSRGPAGRPASGAGFPPSSRPVPFCSSLALILPDFSLARPFLFVQHCALCPILSLPLPHTAVFFRLSGAWESVQETSTSLRFSVFPGPAPSAPACGQKAQKPPWNVPFPPIWGQPPLRVYVCF